MAVSPDLQAVWAFIPGFPDYVVTDQGDVWSCRQSKGKEWRRLRFYVHKGYRHVTLYAPGSRELRTRSVAQLVLLAFVGPKPEGYESCHFPNSDPSDNRLCNLRWASRTENLRDIGRSGNKARGEDSHLAKLSNATVAEIRSLAASGQSYKSIGRSYGLQGSYVGRIVRREIWAYTE